MRCAVVGDTWNRPTVPAAGYDAALPDVGEECAPTGRASQAINVR